MSSRGWRSVAEFLAARHVGWPDVKATGRSSDAMIYYAIHGGWPQVNEFPWDHSDLERCRLTWDLAPPKLQKRMTRILRVYERSFWLSREAA